MKHLHIAAIAAFLLTAAPAMAQKQSITHTFDTLDAVETSDILTTSVGRDVVSAHTYAMDVSGGPATCTVNVQGSLDGTLWFDISGDQDCSSDLMFHIANKPVLFVRINLSALSGGTSPSLSVKFTGSVDN